MPLMRDRDWHYKWHAGIFAGVPQSAQEQRWEPLIEEYCTLGLEHSRPSPAAETAAPQTSLGPVWK